MLLKNTYKIKMFLLGNTIDGTKLKGNASAKRTKDRAGFEKWLSEIEEEIGKILKEGETIDNQEEEKEKINLTDGDANHMKTGGSKDIRPGYNCQAAVTAVGFIMAADSGYGSYSNYEYLDQKGIDGYVPDDHFQQYKSGEYQKEDNRYHYSNFTYDALSDSYVCPEGKRLTYWKTRTNLVLV